MKQGLRTVNSCANCTHCLEDSDFESSAFYCTLDAGPMPADYREYGIETEQTIAAWDAWAHANQVWPNNICSNYIKAE